MVASKKPFAVLLRRLALGMAILALPPWAAAATIDLGDTTGIPGGTATVPITLTGISGLEAGAQFDILYDPAVLNFASCGTDLADHGVYASVTTSPPPPAGMMRVRVIVLDRTLPVVAFASTNIARCTFQILLTTPIGTYPLQGVSPMLGNEAAAALPASAAGGQITVVCGGCGC